MRIVIGLVLLLATAPAAAGVPSRHPAAHFSAVDATPEPVDEATLIGFIIRLKSVAFSKERMATLEHFAREHAFTVEQTRRVVEALSFSTERLRALEAFGPRVIDRQNAAQLEAALPFECERAQARLFVGRP